MDATPRFRKELISDAILSLIRGGAVGAIVSEFIHLPLAYKYSLSSLIGFVPFSHSLYVRYQAGRKKDALNLKEERQKPTENITEEIDNTEQTEPNNANDDKSIIRLLDENNNNESGLIDPVRLAPKLFDEIAASYNSPAFNLAIDAVNFTARFTRFVAFFLFVQTINEVFLDNYFSPISVIGLVFLWGAEVFKNDGDLYGEAMKTTCQSMAAKWQLASARRDSSWCNFFPNAASVVGTSLYDYSLNELKDAKEERSYSRGIQ